jgi:hypothetical protein
MLLVDPIRHLVNFDLYSYSRQIDRRLLLICSRSDRTEIMIDYRITHVFSSPTLILLRVASTDFSSSFNWKMNLEQRRRNVSSFDTIRQ